MAPDPGPIPAAPRNGRPRLILLESPPCSPCSDVTATVAGTGLPFDVTGCLDELLERVARSDAYLAALVREPGADLERRLRRLAAALGELPIIAMAGPADPPYETIRRLIAERVIFDWLPQPPTVGRLCFTLGYLTALGTGAAKPVAPPPLVPAPPGGAASPELIGQSAQMRALGERLEKVARSGWPVLVTGESGTGKEVVARAVHRLSPMHDGPFVPISCAGLPPTLVESELFGHEKGAFTGADRRRIGRIQMAEGGTCFLDEIGDLPLPAQGHLLRFLQEKTVQRLGSTKLETVDVRVVAATNVDLKAAIAEARFREDLFYRLNVLPLHLPPLRERTGDIELLAGHFLHKFAAELGKPGIGFDRDAMRAMLSHSWPGNVRELISVVRRAVVLTDGRLIRAADLQLVPRDEARPAGAATAGRLLLDLPEPATLPEVRARAEEAAVRRALARHSHNVNAAARALGVSRVTLYRMLDRYSIG